MNDKETIKKKLIFMEQSNIAELQSLFEKEAEKGWYYCGNKGYIFYFKNYSTKEIDEIINHITALGKLFKLTETND